MVDLGMSVLNVPIIPSTHSGICKHNLQPDDSEDRLLDLVDKLEK